MVEDRYTHGHHASVVNAHATRTVANSAAYLAEHLEPGQSLLDVGCGPGSITAEFAELVAPGRVLGVDLSADVIDQAAKAHGDSTVEFAAMDLYSLDLEDNSFDVVHAHQVLQHVSDPVAALREMRRVARPGGLVAVRDADYAAMHWSPDSPLLTKWQKIYRAVAYANDAEPDAGRHLTRWAHEAGFEQVTPSVSTWLFASDERRGWWGTTWSQRIVSSSLAEQAVSGGHASSQELQAISDAWLRWTTEPHGWFVVVHGELLCRLPA